MSNHQPVDSATRTCCNGIGTHTPDCGEPRGIPVPAGAVPNSQFDPEDGTRSIVIAIGIVEVWARQCGTGHLAGDPWIMLEQQESEEGFDHHRAVEIAALLVEAAEVAKNLATWTPGDDRR
jgi:hypothetical protein